MGILDILFGGGKKKEMINDALKNGSKIIDVRSKAEFQSGNAQGSINIPLDQISQRAPELKKMKQPLILCCASGMRSGAAVQQLKQHGIESINGGTWLNFAK
ncbi:MAG: rhodanese-like domain-containing protein [Calditrichaeota bacterium]|nr:rhodanese-like domain-containing protein [Calditrichota bacterium]